MRERTVTNEGREQPNARFEYRVSRQDLPVYCPVPEASLWNSHPRVYIPVEEAGEAACHYCGAHFILMD